MGIGLTKSLKRNLDKHLPNNIKTQVTFTGQKLSTQFNVKDRTKFEHKHDVIYFGKCPDRTALVIINYLGESARRISERIIDHGGRDEKSHLFRHAVVNVHGNASYDDFKIIEVASETTRLKERLRPTLNIQEKSVELKLFN